MRTKSDIDKAYKPNGITDNCIHYNGYIDWKYGGKFEEWKRQRQFAKENYRIDLMSKKIHIADSHDITKSNFGL